jgi:aminopeptidase N
MQPLYGRWREGEARYATMLDAQRNQILDLRPIVSGQPRTQDDVYQLERGGPGADIYYKGAWMLHTLRNLIGDRAFRDVTRLTVYGRLDPRPGNFRPRYGTTAEYERDVRRVTGKDFGWFFDVYLRQAALPELIETRQGDRLNLRWQVPGGHPFPMPVEVQVDGRIVHVAMAGGTGSLVVPRHAHVVSDPFSRILKRSRAVEDFQAWKDSEARKAQAK